MSLLSPLLWSFLPGQIAHAILPYLSTVLPGIFPSAPKGTSTYVQNYKLALTSVICLYLAWTFYAENESTGAGASENWYKLLGVATDVDDDGLKRAFRSLSRLHHPDRAGQGSDDTFIMIRRAYETLSDPVKRYAYDRFGPGVLDWKAASFREYTMAGLARSIGFYLVSGGLMLLLSVTGRVQHGAYWRQTLFILLLLLELSLVLTPSTSSALASSNLPLLRPLSALVQRISSFTPQFIQISILRRVFTTLSIAITQLAGVWAEPTSSPPSEEDWNRVLHSLQALQMEAISSFQHEVVPLMSAGEDPSRVQGLIQHHMQEIMVERTIASHPYISQTWREAQARPPTRAMRHMSGTDPVMPPWQQLELARRIPLPLSPPPSPGLEASHL
ncbi:hypothetical protein IAU60_002916 [Kwoniella sp. DSM 27419]